MRADELDHNELLSLHSSRGIIRFAGQRALLIDAVAMGLLRKYLFENFGQIAARTILTQFGFAQGWRMAEAMKSEFSWSTEEDWQAAVTRIQELEGLYCLESGSKGPLDKEGLSVSASYEAEQHLLHFGRSDEAACWTLCGLISGYLSRSTGKDLVVLEDKCTAKGNACCHLIGRSREEWRVERADELRFYEPHHLEECLEVSLKRVTETLKVAERKLQLHKRALVEVMPELVAPLGIVTKSASMRRLVDLACRVAKVDSSVLIIGGSGVGKERIARLLHLESGRAAGPFLAVNCGAIAETLLESELFGHVRGSFTGANQDREGLFEAAKGGTLFLDEVGEVSAGMQVKLLRVLQEREIRRVGDNKTRRVDVRVVTATNRDLANSVENGAFRQDLYYRIKVVELRVPSLRERREDILPLARALLAESARRMKRQIVGMAPNVADRLLSYGWPGNVRELENAMERAVALARAERLELEDLPEEIRTTEVQRASRTETDGPLRLEDVEKEHILRVLANNHGNQTLTAQQLQIGSATLYRRLKAYGLDAKGHAQGVAASKAG